MVSKHRADSAIRLSPAAEARYFGEIFRRPFPEPLPRWDDEAANSAAMWATEHETRAGIVEGYRRAWQHSDATIAALPIGAPGHVPWWPRPDVKLFDIMVHILAETNRHVGHADILREQLDGAVGAYPGGTASEEYDAAYWDGHRAEIERAAKQAADQVAEAAARQPGRGR